MFAYDIYYLWQISYPTCLDEIMIPMLIFKFTVLFKLEYMLDCIPRVRVRVGRLSTTDELREAGQEAWVNPSHPLSPL